MEVIRVTANVATVCLLVVSSLEVMWMGDGASGHLMARDTIDTQVFSGLVTNRSTSILETELHV